MIMDNNSSYWAIKHQSMLGVYERKQDQIVFLTDV